MQENDYLGDLQGYYFVLQDDCNLVLFDHAESYSVWYSNTPLSDVTCEFALTREGRMVVYEKVIQIMCIGE